MIMDREEEGTLTPVMTDDDVTFIHIKCNNIYVVAVTQGKISIIKFFQYNRFFRKRECDVHCFVYAQIVSSFRRIF